MWFDEISKKELSTKNIQSVETNKNNSTQPQQHETQSVLNNNDSQVFINV